MRTARQTLPGVVHHLIWRFVDREWFFTSEEERSFYLQLLGRALSESDWRCLAYALMSNHLHFAMVAGHTRLAAWSRRVNSPFAQWMNQRHGRLGPLMADRSKDFAVVPPNEGQLIAYVHNNPVRAGVVTRASDSDWTSHKAYLGRVRPPAWLRVEEGLARVGADATHFDEWVHTSGQSGEVDLDGVRRAARRRGALEIATPSRDEVPLVARPFAHLRPDPRHIVGITADVVGVSKASMCSQQRSHGVVAARRVAVHFGRAIGISGSDMAAALGLSAQAVSAIGLRTLDAADSAVMELVSRRLRLELLATSGGPSLGVK